MITDHRDVAQQLLDALEDDAMRATEIRRQLAKRGVILTEDELTGVLQTMLAGGRLAARTIGGETCWSAT